MVKEVILYSTFIVVPHTQGAQVRIKQCHLQITPYLPPPRKHSPDGASPDWGCGHLIAAYYSFVYTRKDERLSRHGWLTYSGRFPHISGHPSAAGQAQDSEISQVKDRRSTTVPRNQRVCSEFTSSGTIQYRRSVIRLMSFVWTTGRRIRWTDAGRTSLECIRNGWRCSRHNVTSQLQIVTYYCSYCQQIEHFQAKNKDFMICWF